MSASKKNHVRSICEEYGITPDLLAEIAEIPDQHAKDIYLGKANCELASAVLRKLGIKVIVPLAEAHAYEFSNDRLIEVFQDESWRAAHGQIVLPRNRLELHLAIKEMMKTTNDYQAAPMLRAQCIPSRKRWTKGEIWDWWKPHYKCDSRPLPLKRVKLEWPLHVVMTTIIRVAYSPHLEQICEVNTKESSVEVKIKRIPLFLSDRIHKHFEKYLIGDQSAQRLSSNPTG